MCISTEPALFAFSSFPEPANFKLFPWQCFVIVRWSLFSCNTGILLSPLLRLSLLLKLLGLNLRLVELGLDLHQVGRLRVLVATDQELGLFGRLVFQLVSHLSLLDPEVGSLSVQLPHLLL